MSRTYWAQREGGYEFLGAFSDGHTLTDRQKTQPQAQAGILDFPGVPIESTLASFGDRTMLVELPAKISNRLAARIPMDVTMEQIEGFLK